MSTTSQLGLLFAAGGSSRRFGGGSKLFAQFRQAPLFIHALKNLCRPEIPAVLVVAADTENDIREELVRHGLEYVQIVRGGSSRSESVCNGLQALCALPNPPQYIAIHDAARPLATYKLLMACLENLQDADGSIAAHPVTDTIHCTDAAGRLLSTPPRSQLWAAETPQLFRTATLLRAFNELPWRTSPPTDEAALVAALPGTVVRMTPNTDYNPKVTFQDDLRRLEQML